MPRRRPVHGLGGTLIDHRHVHQAAGSAGVWAPVRLTAAPPGAQRVRHLAVQPAQLRAVDRLIDRLGHQVPIRLVGKLHPERLADLLRAPPLLQPLGHKLTQHRVIDQLAATGPCPPIHGQPLRGERAVLTAAFVTVAAQLPTHRRRTPAHLDRDRPHRQTTPLQIRNPDPIVLRQVPRRDLRLPHRDHGRIVQPPPRTARDFPPAPPACPGPPIDPHHPARLSVGHPARDQPRELLTLLRLRRHSWSTTNHRNSRTPPVLRRSLETAPALQLQVGPLQTGTLTLPTCETTSGLRWSTTTACSTRCSTPRTPTRMPAQVIPRSTAGWGSPTSMAWHAWVP